MTTPRVPYPITAFSLACSLGHTTDACLAELRAGRRGIRDVPFDVPFEANVGAILGELPSLPAELAAYTSRSAQIATLAYPEIEAAVASAKARYGAARIGLVVGTSTGGIDRTEAEYFNYFDSDEKAGWKPSAAYQYAKQHTFHACADYVGMLAGIEGPRLVVSTACSSSAKAFGTARRLLDLNVIDAALILGVDGLCNTTVRGFNSLGVMADEPSRPFGMDRPGMNVGEGAAYVLLERESDAPRAFLRGVGETSDAYHMSSPEPNGAGAEAAMRDALAQAGLDASAVQYINAHGTGTKYNDAAESKAVIRVFGDEVPVVSTKAYTGHTLGACGAVEAIFAVKAIEEGWIPAAIGADPRDPEIEVHVPTEIVETQIDTVLSNAFAFGGNNCSLVIGREA